MAWASKKDMEINTASPLIKKLANLRESDADFARDVVEQMYDNAMIQAGLLVDPMAMVQRNYRILERAAGESSTAADPERPQSLRPAAKVHP